MKREASDLLCIIVGVLMVAVENSSAVNIKGKRFIFIAFYIAIAIAIDIVK